MQCPILSSICLLTQMRGETTENQLVNIQHPITYVSGMFQGSEINGTALTKDAFPIYMIIKKLAFCLRDVDTLCNEKVTSRVKGLLRRTPRIDI